jgi:hypothetical protein
MDELQKLYRELNDKGYYTKSFDEFSKQLEDDSYKQKVYDVVSKDGLYTKDYDSFSSKYYAEDIKKKDDTDSTSLEVSSDGQEIEEAEEDSFQAADVLGDFFGGAIDAGVRQGKTVDETLGVMWSGEEASDEQVDAYLKAVQKLNQDGPSKEMIQFQKDVKEAGGGMMGFISALGNTDTSAPVILETAITSFSGMLSAGITSKEGAGAVAAGAATGAALGATTLAFAPVTSTVGGVAGAMGAAGGVLETAMSFTEFLKEEIGDKEFTPENIRAILNDPEKLNSIRKKAVIRGGVIGMVDAISGGLAGSASKSTAKTLAKTSGVVRKGAAGAVATTIEAAGGGVGEAAARAAAGQEMDAVEIGLEAVGGAPRALISAPVGFMSESRRKVYTQNGKEITRDQASFILKNLTDQQLADVDMSVKNDATLEAILKTKKKRGKVKNNLPDNISKENVEKVVDLEIEKQNLDNKNTESAKQRSKQVSDQIAELSKPVQEKVDDSEKAYTFDADVEEKDGVKTTKFNKYKNGKKLTGGEQSPDVINEMGYEIADEEGILDNLEIVGVSEVREGETGAAATVTVKNKETGSLERGYEFSLEKKEQAKEASPEQSQEQLEQQQRQGVDDIEQQPEPQKKTFFERYKDLGKTLSNLKKKVGLDPKRGNKVIRDEQERTKGNVSAESYIALNTLKKIGKLTGKDQNAEIVANKVLRGEEITEQESTKYTKLILESQKARTNIDNLSQQLIDLGVLPKKSAENVADNLGTYITRAYEAFENPNFIPTTAARTQAKEFLLANPEYIQEASEVIAEEQGMSLEEALDEQADKYLDDLLEKQSGDTFLSREYKLKKGILKRRKDVPKALRGFLGEIESGTEGYYITHLKLSNLLNTARYQKAMLDKGLGKFIFERKNRPQGTVQIKGSAYSILDGYFASQETIDSIIPKQQQNNYNSLVNFLLDINGLTKGWLTVYNPASYFRNYISTLQMLGSRGDGNSLSDIVKAHKDYKAFWLNQPDVNQKIVEYKKAGIIGQNVAAGAIESILNDRTKDPMTSLAYEMSGSKKKKGVLGFLNKRPREFIRLLYKIPVKVPFTKVKVGDVIEGTAAFMQSTFQAGDDVGKIIAYEQRKKFYADALFDRPFDKLTESEQEQVIERASDEIKNQYNNYDRVPPTIKQIGKMPAFGPFVQFPAEMIRNTVNIYGSAIDNMNSGNKKLKADAIKRIATFTSIQGILLTASTVLGDRILDAFDLGDDEEQKTKDLRNIVAPWSRNHKILASKVENNILYYTDASAHNPSAFMGKMTQEGLNADNAFDAVTGAVYEFYAPFVQEEVLGKSSREALAGRTDSGKPIWYKQDNLAEKLVSGAMHMAESATPGYYRTLKRMYEKDFQNEIISLTGFRRTKVKLDTSLYFKMKDIYEISEDIKSKYRAEKREDESTSVESFQEEYDIEFKKASEIYMSHLRIGLDSELAFSQLKKMMGKNQKFNNAEIKAIITGRKPPLIE